MSKLAGWKVGVVGLGHMGRPMARNLKRAGATVYMHSRDRAKVADLEEEGLHYCANPAALTRNVGDGVVLICVTDTPAVETVLRGEEGVLTALKAGALVIDMGTTQVMNTRELAEAVRSRGGDYLDAPVSGGAVGAEQASLSIMVGGSEEGFQRALPLFEVLGQNINHVGDSGAGQVAKSANQLIVAMTVDAVAEGLTLARAAGVDPSKVRQALLGGFADSRILELHGQRMVERQFEPGARATIQLKDVEQAIELAEYCEIDLPGLSANRDRWREMIARGWGNLDQAGLIRVFEKETKGPED